MGDVKQVAAARVRDYMTPNPQTLEHQSTLLEAVLMMRRAELRHIPILAGGRLVGIVTDRDVARFTPSMLMGITPQDYNRVFEETLVEKVMTRNPISTTPEVQLSEAVNLFYHQKLGCLPVLEGERLVGIVTRVDMLRALHDLIGDPASPGQS